MEQKVNLKQYEKTTTRTKRHNRKIRVKEGENVQAGQVIAELGSSGTERAMLHFEIRKNGNPVNPTYYLPAR